MQRRQLLRHTGALAAGWIATQAAWAQSSSTPIRVMVGFAPGGSVDSLARMTGEALNSSGRLAVVENKAGAGGRLAADLVKSSAPDGHTLLVAPQGPMTLFPHVFKQNLKYDPARDFSPITRLANGDFALSVGPMVPAKDLRGVIEWLRQAGPKATYGSPGAGTLPHFTGVMLAQKLGIELVHVPYQGSAKSIIDLAGGNVATVISPVTEALELHKAGRVHIVGITGEKRSPFVPDVPTFKEIGVDVAVPVWFAVYGPAGMPKATVEALRGAIDKGFGTKESTERLARLGLEAAPLDPAGVEALRRSETAMWGPVVASSGFTPSN